MNRYIHYIVKAKSKVFLQSRIKNFNFLSSIDFVDFRLMNHFYSFFVSYHKGFFELYYYGKVVSFSKSLLSLKINVRRFSDRSMVSIFLNSPYLVNIYFFHGNR